MELRQLRVFVAIVEERHLGRASSRLRLTPQAVSKTLAALEREAGGRLVDRHPRGVEVTEAGRSFVARARAILAAADETLLELRAQASGETGPLCVGIFAQGAAELTAPILDGFRAAHPGLHLIFRSLGFADQTDAIVHGGVDVALVRPPFGDDRLQVDVLAVEPRTVWISHRHRLAEADAVTAEDILDGPFTVACPESPAAWQNYWLCVDQRNGLTPRLTGQTIGSVEDMILVSAYGDGVTTTAASTSRYYPHPRVRSVPVIDLAGSPMAVATRRGESRQVVNDFMQIARKAAARHLHLVPGAVPPGQVAPTAASD